MLKATMYQGMHGEWPVVYLLLGNECVFTGVNSVASRPTTINFAEEIINAICEQERRDPRSLRFFDLQTHLGYGHQGEGEFEFDEVAFNDEPNGDRLFWSPVTCPDTVVDAFRQFITGTCGPSPVQKMFGRKLATAKN